MSTGIFHDRESVVEALEQLSEHHVPPERIDVALVDDSGFHRRKVGVRAGVGAVRGLTVGLAVGVAVGVPAFAALSGAEPGPTAAGSVLAGDAAVWGAIAGAAVGAPFGAFIGFRRARTRVALTPEDLQEGAVVVTVRSTSADLDETARSILANAGADRVSGDRLHDQHRTRPNDGASS